MSTTRRPWLIPVLVVGVAIAAFLAFGVFGVHLLFVDEEVSEAAPVFTTVEAAVETAVETDDEAAVETDGSEDAAADGTAENSSENSTTEEPQSVEPVTEASGDFIGAAHPTSGTAVVLSDGNTQRVLRLEDDFATDNGPDLNIYLASSADDFGDEYIDLGDLKGNIGAQNYEIPTDVDLSLYDTVVIWCVRFGVGFGSAELGIA